MSSLKLEECCPNCGTVHKLSEVERDANGKSLYSRSNVKCCCGFTLKWVVPLFRTTSSGYVLQIVVDSSSAEKVADILRTQEEV